MPPAAADTWTSPQTIIGLATLTIMGATVAGVFWLGDKAMIGQTAGGVIGLGGAVIGFYFQTAISSQRKDSTIDALSKREP
jgi:hypothetical protein